MCISPTMPKFSRKITTKFTVNEGKADFRMNFTVKNIKKLCYFTVNFDIKSMPHMLTINSTIIYQENSAPYTNHKISLTHPQINALSASAERRPK